MASNSTAESTRTSSFGSTRKSSITPQSLNAIIKKTAIAGIRGLLDQYEDSFNEIHVKMLWNRYDRQEDRRDSYPNKLISVTLRELRRVDPEGLCCILKQVKDSQWISQTDRRYLLDAIFDRFQELTGFSRRESRRNNPSDYLLLSSFTAQNLSTLVHCYARQNSKHGKLNEAVAQAVMARSKRDVTLEEFSATDLCLILKSFAELRIRDELLFQTISEAVIQRYEKDSTLTAFSPLDLNELVWSFAKVQISHQKLFDTVAKVVINRSGKDPFLKEFGMTHFQGLTLSFAKGWTPSVTGESLSDENVHKMLSAIQPLFLSPERLNASRQRQLIGFLWGYAVWNRLTAELVNAVIPYIKSEGLRERELTQLVQLSLEIQQKKLNVILSKDLQTAIETYKYWEEEEYTTTDFHREVVDLLKEMAEVETHRVLLNCYKAEIYVPGNQLIVRLRGEKSTGADRLRIRQLEGAGYRVALIYAREWDSMYNNAKRDHLRQLLA